MLPRSSFFLLTVALFALAGCASYTPVALAPALDASLPGAALAHTDRPSSDLYIFSTGDATLGILGGAIGGAIAGAAGDKSDNAELRAAGIVYPNELLRARLLERMRAKYHVSVSGSKGVALDDKKHDFVPATSTTSARYILDTDAGWMCSYLPLNWGRYQFQVFYSVKLLDRADGKVLFDERFIWRTPKELGHPSRKEFITDETKGVRAQLAAATAAAEAHFAEKLKL
jgi:hypothetical protein